MKLEANHLATWGKRILVSRVCEQGLERGQHGQTSARQQARSSRSTCDQFCLHPTASHSFTATLSLVTSTTTTSLEKPSFIRPDQRDLLTLQKYSIYCLPSSFDAAPLLLEINVCRFHSAINHRLQIAGIFFPASSRNSEDRDIDFL